MAETPTIQLPIQNFPAQQKIFNQEEKFVIVPKGRRFGATRGAANDFILKAAQKKYTRGLWVDTINSNIERYVERYFLPALQKLPKQYWSWRKQQKILKIFDSVIDFRSADNPETLEGFDYDKAFLNEAGIILKDEYLWTNAILPMLWDEKVKVVVAGTPKSKGIFEQLYKRGLDPDQKDYRSFKFTSFDNPYVPHDVIMEDMKTMPERVVKQEIYAEFLDESGIVFRGTNEVAILKPQPPEIGTLYIIGADLAKLQDYTVLTVFNRRTNDQVFQMRFNKLDWPFQRQKIKDLSAKYNGALVVADATGIGDPVIDDLLRMGVPVEPIKLNNELKRQIIEKLSNWIELKNFRMLQLDETINEFNSFTYDYSEKTGRVLYNAPAGFHDDIVISIGLAIWNLQPLIKQPEIKPEGIIARDVRAKIQQLEETQNEGFDFNSTSDWEEY